MTDSKLTSAVKEVASIVLTVSGVAGAPDFPPESLNYFPFAVTYPVRGRYILSPAQTMTELHSIAVELHINKKHLPIDVEKLLQFAEAIPEAIMKTYNLNGKVQTFGEITYDIKYVEWGNIETLALVFTIHDVKIQEDL